MYTSTWATSGPASARPVSSVPCSISVLKSTGVPRASRQPLGPSLASNTVARGLAARTRAPGGRHAAAGASRTKLGTESTVARLPTADASKSRANVPTVAPLDSSHAAVAWPPLSIATVGTVDPGENGRAGASTYDLGTPAAAPT